MARGSVSCRHTLQTGLLNCGLEHTGTGLRNVHTLGRKVGDAEGKAWLQQQKEEQREEQRQQNLFPRVTCRYVWR